MSKNYFLPESRYAPLILEAALDEHEKTGSTFLSHDKRMLLAARLGLSESQVAVGAHLAGFLAAELLESLDLDLLDIQLDGEA